MEWELENALFGNSILEAHIMVTPSFQWTGKIQISNLHTVYKVSFGRYSKKIFATEVGSQLDIPFAMVQTITSRYCNPNSLLP